MHASRRVTCWAIVCLLALAGSACGSDQSSTSKPDEGPSTREYEAAVRDVHAEMNEAMAAAFGTKQLDPNLVSAAGDTAGTSIETMRSLEPPERFEQAHDEYTKGLEVFADILADVERQVGDPDVARRHLGDERFTTGVGHLEQASDLYREAGLDLDSEAEGA